MMNDIHNLLDTILQFDIDRLDDGPPTVQQVFKSYQDRISELKKQTLEGLMVMQKVKKYVEDSPNGS